MVFMGDSHVELGINPNLISDKLINVGLGGESINTTFIKLKIIEKLYPHINTYFISIDPHRFYQTPSELDVRDILYLNRSLYFEFLSFSFVLLCKLL